MMAGILATIAKALPAATSIKSLGILAGLSIAAGVGAIVEGPVLVHWLLHRHDPAPLTAKAQARIDAAGTAIAADAVARQAGHDAAVVRIQTVTQEGTAHVLATSGASQSAPDVARALHDALCLSDVYAAEPDCAALRPDRAGGGAAPADTGSAAPGGR